MGFQNTMLLPFYHIFSVFLQNIYFTFNLQILVLSSNRLTGDIPKELCALTNLQTLKLGGNTDLVTIGGNEIKLPIGEGNVISISDLCQGF